MTFIDFNTNFKLELLIKGTIGGAGLLFASYQLNQLRPIEADNQRTQNTYGWGSSQKGQLGQGKINSSVSIPTLIE